MFDVSETLARHRLFRKAAMVAVVVPAALLAACGQPTDVLRAPLVPDGRTIHQD